MSERFRVRLCGGKLLCISYEIMQFSIRDGLLREAFFPLSFCKSINYLSVSPATFRSFPTFPRSVGFSNILSFSTALTDERILLCPRGRVMAFFCRLTIIILYLCHKSQEALAASAHPHTHAPGYWEGFWDISRSEMVPSTWNEVSFITNSFNEINY